MDICPQDPGVIADLMVHCLLQHNHDFSFLLVAVFLRLWTHIPARYSSGIETRPQQQ